MGMWAYGLRLEDTCFHNNSRWVDMGLSVKVCVYLFLYLECYILGGAIKWMLFEKFLAFRCCWGQVALQIIAEVLFNCRYFFLIIWVHFMRRSFG